MFYKKNKLVIYLIITVTLTLGLSISLQSLLAAWTPPTAVPPNDNIDIPINQGEFLQNKSGPLEVSINTTQDTMYGTDTPTLTLHNTSDTHSSFRINDSALDTTPFMIDGDGKVGIGTDSPEYKLHVSGAEGAYITNSIADDWDEVYALRAEAFNETDDDYVIALFGEASGGDEAWGVQGSASGAYYNYGVEGYAYGEADENYGVYGYANSAYENYGVYGYAAGGSDVNYGVYGYSNSGFDDVTANYGVVAESNEGLGSSVTNYGLYASASGATSKNWAGYFDEGDVYIGGKVGIGADPGTYLLNVAGSLNATAIKVSGVDVLTFYTETDPTYTTWYNSGSPSLTALTMNGNISLAAEATVDGVDISDYSAFFIHEAGTSGQVWKSDGTGRGGWGTDSTDHGALSGRGDDDHTQYLLVTGDRNVTGRLILESTLQVNDNAHVMGDLTVDGDLILSSTDLAEGFEVLGEAEAEAGDVLIIAYDKKLKKSNKPYDRLVAGVVSTEPAIMLGDKEKTQVALAGTVPVKVTNEGGAISPGDMLTTSSAPGYAMKCSDITKCFGATIGKALEGMSGETGVIKMIVGLQ